MEIPQLSQARRLFLAIGQLHVPSCGLGGVRPSGAEINTAIHLFGLYRPGKEGWYGPAESALLISGPG